MSIKFSVLLPTKNRLQLLRQAVETVRRQSYADWEIVVADNVSEEDIAGYVLGLDEPRVRYVRAAKPLPVTENWNLALRHSTGDYVIMLGDDDGLLRGHLEAVAFSIRAFDFPNLVLTDAFLFAYPNVIPGHPSGFLQIGYGVFFEGRTEPYLLDREMAEHAVHRALNFRVEYQFNMQYSVISRRLIEKARPYGPYFQSPYPDFYASNANLLLADRVLVIPKPMVCIGITPKSFGYYYFNRRQEEGTRFLNNVEDGEARRRLETYLLPGSDLFSCWLVAVETVRGNFRGFTVRGEALKVAYQRYRFVQLWHAARLADLGILPRLCARAKWWELLLFPLLVLLVLLARLLRAVPLLRAAGRKLDGLISPFPDRDTRVREIAARDMVEVFESVDPEYY